MKTYWSVDLASNNIIEHIPSLKGKVRTSGLGVGSVLPSLDSTSAASSLLASQQVFSFWIFSMISVSPGVFRSSPTGLVKDIYSLLWISKRNKEKQSNSLCVPCILCNHGLGRNVHHRATFMGLIHQAGEGKGAYSSLFFQFQVAVLISTMSVEIWVSCGRQGFYGLDGVIENMTGGIWQQRKLTILKLTRFSTFHLATRNWDLELCKYFNV